MAYKPERFSPEKAAEMDTYQFIPFSAGQRNCIGQNFAMNEMKLTVAHVVRSFRLMEVPNKPARRLLNVTLKAQGGAFLKLTPRA